MSNITKQDVFEAIDTLVQRGARPSVRAISAHLGRGSWATINKYRQQWEAATRNGIPDRMTADELLEVRVAREMVRAATIETAEFKERALIAEERVSSEIRLLNDALSVSERTLRSLAYVVQDMQALAMLRGAFGTTRQKDNLDALWVQAIRRAREDEHAATVRGHGKIKPGPLLAAELSLSHAYAMLNSGD